MLPLDRKLVSLKKNQPSEFQERKVSSGAPGLVDRVFAAHAGS